MLNRFSVAATLALRVGCQTTSSPEATKQTSDRGYMHALNVAGNKFCGYYLDHEYTQVCMKNLSAEARTRGGNSPSSYFFTAAFISTATTPLGLPIWDISPSPRSVFNGRGGGPNAPPGFRKISSI